MEPSPKIPKLAVHKILPSRELTFDKTKYALFN